MDSALWMIHLHQMFLPEPLPDDHLHHFGPALPDDPLADVPLNLHFPFISTT
jgi:hypothetical protein